MQEQASTSFAPPGCPPPTAYTAAAVRRRQCQLLWCCSALLRGGRGHQRHPHPHLHLRRKRLEHRPGACNGRCHAHRSTRRPVPIVEEELVAAGLTDKVAAPLIHFGDESNPAKKSHRKLRCLLYYTRWEMVRIARGEDLVRVLFHRSPSWQ